MWIIRLCLSTLSIIFLNLSNMEFITALSWFPFCMYLIILFNHVNLCLSGVFKIGLISIWQCSCFRTFSSSICWPNKAFLPACCINFKRRLQGPLSVIHDLKTALVLLGVVILRKWRMHNLWGSRLASVSKLIWWKAISNSPTLANKLSVNLNPFRAMELIRPIYLRMCVYSSAFFFDYQCTLYRWTSIIHWIRLVVYYSEVRNYFWSSRKLLK